MSPSVPVTVVLLAVVTFAFAPGCAARRVSQVDPQARATIGYAATAQYPGNPQTPTQRVLAAALDHVDGKHLELLNLSQNAITSPTLWINGTYVRQLSTIPAQGTLDVQYAGLLQAGQPANDFAHAGQSVSKVELQTSEGLFSVYGPAIQR